MKKIGSELTDKFLQNDFFLPGTYFFELGIEFYIQNPAILLSFSQNGLWSVPNKQNPTFYMIFLDPNFLRYGQDLYRAHTGHSWVSSLPIGLLYFHHPLPTLALQNFFEIFVRYSQSLYKTQIRKSWHHPSL